MRDLANGEHQVAGYRIRAALATMLAVGIVTGGMVAMPQPVEAQGFFERLFGTSAREKARRQNAERQRARQIASTRPVPRIRGPQYFTYRPDSLRLAVFETAEPLQGDAAGSRFPALTLDNLAQARRYLVDMRLRALDPVAMALEDWYGSDRPLLWVSGTGENARARAVIAVLNRAGEVGLDPEDYAVEEPSRGFDMARTQERLRLLMRFEIEMSRAVLTYALDAARGRVDANRISGYHDIERKSVDLEAVLDDMLVAPDPALLLASFNPQGRHFAALADELAALQGASDDDVIILPESILLKPGGTSDDLPALLAAVKMSATPELVALHAATFADDDENRLAYTPDKVALIRDYQEERGLMVDGIIGPATLAAVKRRTNADKRRMIRLAMERARWLPGTLPARHVFINQPEFVARYLENGHETLSMRVVVGTKANQTYFFSDEIELVEFNPYWGVPQSIIVNEMMPKLRADPGYLDRLGYEVSYKGRRIPSSAVNWNANPRVDVRQPPGSDNALGELKILFPNSHSIYMHDTPAKRLFARDNRAYSHGCIRLEDPRAMAAVVLGTDQQEVASHIAGKRNLRVAVPEKIPVYVAYFTAWPAQDGTIGYHADIYDRDLYLQRALDAASDARRAGG